MRHPLLKGHFGSITRRSPANEYYVIRAIPIHLDQGQPRELYAVFESPSIFIAKNESNAPFPPNVPGSETWFQKIGG